mmetsp:Transcript_34121/g.85446  ORF Transcript_34121/g.85446 Transcript_34121/m.85446 type:complete len:145 (+) Transcript_34121:99-533(+)
MASTASIASHAAVPCASRALSASSRPWHARQQAQHRRSRHALAHRRGSQTIAAAAPSPKPRAKSEFKPSEMVDAPHSIRTWDVYRLVESQRVEKQIKDLAEFRDSRRLEGMAAQQCQEAIEALERVVQVLDAECVGEECGFRYD